MRFRAPAAIALVLFSGAAAGQVTLIAPTPPPVSSRPAPPSQCKLEDYPLAAVRAEVTGETVLAYTLDARGFLLTTRVVRTAGTTREHKLLDAASVRSLWTCRFKAVPDDSGHTFMNSYNWKLDEAVPPSTAASSSVGK